MGSRRILLTLAATLLLIATTAGAGILWFKNAPRRTPAGQAPLSRLDAETLPALRDAFNADADKTRVIVLLSPT